MVYLFWSIAVGLGAGTFNWTVVILSTLIILVAAMVLYFFKYGRGQSQDYVLVVTGDKGMDPNQIKGLIDQYSSDVKIRSQTVNQDLWEIVYEMHIRKTTQPLSQLIEDLNQLPEITNVSLLAPQLALPA